MPDNIKTEVPSVHVPVGAPAPPAAEIPPPAADATEVLQNLLGISTIAIQIKKVLISREISEHMAEAISNGIKRVLADQDYFSLLVSVLGDSMIRFLTQLVDDPELEDKALEFCMKAASNDTVKGALADAVFHGSKRLCEDSQAQQSLTTVANMIVASQPFTNVLNRTVELASKRNHDFFTGEAFQGLLAENRDQTISKLQDTINLCLSESVQDLKTLKLSLSLSTAEADSVSV